jgi:hypothetical protein
MLPGLGLRALQRGQSKISCAWCFRRRPPFRWKMRVSRCLGREVQIFRGKNPCFCLASLRPWNGCVMAFKLEGWPCFCVSISRVRLRDAASCQARPSCEDGGAHVVGSANLVMRYYQYINM